MSKSRINVADLTWAKAWIDAFDPSGDPECAQVQKRVIEWINAEIETRELDSIIRKMRKELPHVPVATIREKVRSRLKG